jgi:hypothetical protein
MFDFEQNIDLDALFDSLSIPVPQVDSSPGSSKRAAFSNSGAELPEVDEVSTIEVDLFLFDNPADQS